MKKIHAICKCLAATLIINASVVNAGIPRFPDVPNIINDILDSAIEVAQSSEVIDAVQSGMTAAVDMAQASNSKANEVAANKIIRLGAQKAALQKAEIMEMQQSSVKADEDVGLAQLKVAADLSAKENMAALKAADKEAPEGAFLEMILRKQALQAEDFVTLGSIESANADAMTVTSGTVEEKLLVDATYLMSEADNRVQLSVDNSEAARRQIDLLAPKPVLAIDASSAVMANSTHKLSLDHITSYVLRQIPRRILQARYVERTSSMPFLSSDAWRKYIVERENNPSWTALYASSINVIATGLSRERTSMAATRLELQYQILISTLSEEFETALRLRNRFEAGDTWNL